MNARSPRPDATVAHSAGAAVATGIAHDLKNLLAAIAGSLELAQRAPEDAEACVLTAARATERARDLVQYLVQLQHTGDRVEPVDLEALVAETVAFVTATSAAPVVHVDLGHGPTVAYGETRQLQRAVLNLVVNACDALEERAQVAGHGYVPTLRISVERDELEDMRAVAVVVADNGVGMAPDLQARVFDPFVTSKEDRGGTGLGLAIVRAIARDHQGRVDLASTEGHGTVFRLVLPAVPWGARAQAVGHGRPGRS